MRLNLSTDLTADTVSPEVARGMATVTEDALKTMVEKLSIPRNFYSQRENNLATARFLKDRFAGWGYTVQTQGELNNILALPKTPPRLLIGAHYDSVPQTPGADDNASAVAAMLGCAEVMARFFQDAPVCFVAFNCEENDLAGSKDFVANFLPRSGLPLTQVHILEMVGFANPQPGSQRIPTGLPIQIPDTGDFLGLLADNRSAAALQLVLTQAKTYLSAFKAIGLEVPVGIETVFPVLARSDHVPFWHAGIPAVMWTDTSEFRNSNYHHPTDTPDTLDYSFLRQVTQLLIATVAGTPQEI